MKGANLGLGGSVFNVLNENEGVTYTEDHVKFTEQPNTNLTAVGLKTVEIVDFTLSWWMTPDTNLISPTDSKVVIDTWSPGETTPVVSFHVWLGYENKVSVVAKDDETGEPWYTVAADNLEPNKWTFVTYVHNTASGQGTLYFNATEVPYSSRSTITGASKTSRRIGDHFKLGCISPKRSSPNGVHNYFFGNVKCISLATRILAIDEISELMNMCE